jgi:cell surface protein SprA
MQKRRPKPKEKKEKEIDKNADGVGDPNEPKKKKKEKKPTDYTMADRFAKFLMSIERGSITYSRSRGSMLPGYSEKHDVLGMNSLFGSNPAPGWGFIFGQQYESSGEYSFWQKAGQNGWLQENSNINYRVSQTYSENINLNVSASPLPDLRVTLTANRRESWNYSLFFRYDSIAGNYNEESPVRQGQFSVSFWSMPTSLLRDDEGTGSNAAFDQFLSNRVDISRRLGQEDPNSNGAHEVNAEYAEGYGPTSADVLIPSFIAAYGKKDVNEQKLNIFKSFPAINYRLTYNGLGKIAALKKYFRTVTLSSGYTSSMSIGGYIQNQRFGELDDNGDLALDLDSNFFTKYQYNSVTINESFSPLININMQWKNKMTTRFEFKKSRTIGLNVGSAQVMEQRTEAITVGLGYQFPFVFPMEIMGKKPKSDLKLLGDFSYRKNKTLIRKIIDNSHTPTAGQNVISVKATADYALTKNLNIRAFYDYVLNIPQISNTFKTANTNFGFSLRFSIS